MPARGPSRPVWSVLGSPPFITRTVALLTQSYPAVLRQLFHSVSQPSRGCLHRLQKNGERTTSLPRDSVCCDAYLLGLRIQGLPFPDHHLKLTRHASYVCVAAVDGIQLRITECEEALGEFIETAAVGHFSWKATC